VWFYFVQNSSFSCTNVISVSSVCVFVILYSNFVICAVKTLWFLYDSKVLLDESETVQRVPRVVQEVCHPYGARCKVSCCCRGQLVEKTEYKKARNDNSNFLCNMYKWLCIFCILKSCTHKTVFLIFLSTFNYIYNFFQFLFWKY